jgi:hypothetical protein
MQSAGTDPSSQARGFARREGSRLHRAMSRSIGIPMNLCSAHDFGVLVQMCYRISVTAISVPNSVGLAQCPCQFRGRQPKLSVLILAQSKLIGRRDGTTCDLYLAWKGKDSIHQVWLDTFPIDIGWK